jgi:hypothetical protein
MRRALCLAVLILALSTAAFAQFGTEGAILGTVTDQSGALVPGADVTIQELSTGMTKTVKTDQGGEFEVPALPLGVYSVTVTMQGFKTWKLDRAELTIGQRKRLPVVLEVGATNQEVSVTAAAPLLQSDTTQTGGVVEQKQVVDLPLDGRNPIEMTSFTPGIIFEGQKNPENGSFIYGNGVRDYETQYSLDGMNVNAAMDEGAIGIPNVDSIGEFSIQTENFGADLGRNPMQVLMVTKSGTNSLHGTLWEFNRNNATDARNFFAATTPKLNRNQFGVAAGGPIIKNKTFIFGSYEGTRIRQSEIYNEPVVPTAFYSGDFSSLSTQITDPTTGQPFPGNQIQPGRIDTAAQFFFKYIPQANTPGNLYDALAPESTETDNGILRIDHQLTSKQRIYGRYVDYRNFANVPGYLPTVPNPAVVAQLNMGVNYDYSITPSILFTLSLEYFNSNFNSDSPGFTGQENLTTEAGIQGYPTSIEGKFIGLPAVSFSGYSGFGLPWGVPERLWSENKNGKAGLNIIRGKHTMKMGYEFDNRGTFGDHASCCARGNFGFNGQYTGNGFADYLLGLPQWAYRTFPLDTFGTKDAPYDAVFFEDYFNVSPKLTLNLGVRFDHWQAQEAVCGNVSTWDPKIGKAVAGLDNSGKVNLNCRAVAPYVAAATAAYWVPANQVGYPKGDLFPSSYVSPRLGVAWRPKGDLVVRGAYGIFAYRGETGNAQASAIVGPPYWNYESATFSSESMQKWETAYPSNPTTFVAPGVTAPAADMGNVRTHEWNIAVQKELPFKSALTVGYMGSHTFGPETGINYNEVPPGNYPDLQAAKPYPALGQIQTYQKNGATWYNALTVLWERRFTNGLAFTGSYAYSKTMDNNTEDYVQSSIQPFTPAGYLRGLSSLNHTNLLTINAIYNLPFGHGLRYLTNVNRVANGFLGGWELSGILRHVSGDPLTMDQPGATLGDGWDTRPDLVGNPHVPNPSHNLWFNPAAFAAPPDYQWGNSPIGFMDGPGMTVLNTALMKNFHFSEARYLQVRWEMFNALNHTNFGDPATTSGYPGYTGVIYGSGPARDMQFGLKFYF